MNEELALVLAGVRRFIRRDIWLHEKRLNANATRLPDQVFDELHGRVDEMGLDHLLAPPGCGYGPELSEAERARVVEETSQHRAGAISAGYGLFDPDPSPQLYAATEQQRAAFLTPLLEREARCFRGFGDPDLAGLPTDGVRLRALRRDGEWMLDGTKVFVADATDADLGIVYAHTEYERGERDGVSAFVVETSRTGFQRWREWPTISLGRDTWELNLSALKLPDLNLLGEAGDASAFGNDPVLRRRMLSAAQLTGVASAAQDMARGQVWSRPEHGIPIAQGQRAQLALADSEIAIRASRELYLAAAAECDEGALTVEGRVVGAGVRERGRDRRGRPHPGAAWPARALGRPTAGALGARPAHPPRRRGRPHPTAPPHRAAADDDVQEVGGSSRAAAAISSRPRGVIGGLWRGPRTSR